MIISTRRAAHRMHRAGVNCDTCSILAVAHAASSSSPAVTTGTGNTFTVNAQSTASHTVTINTAQNIYYTSIHTNVHRQRAAAFRKRPSNTSVMKEANRKVNDVADLIGFALDSQFCTRPFFEVLALWMKCEALRSNVNDDVCDENATSTADSVNSSMVRRKIPSPASRVTGTATNSDSASTNGNREFTNCKRKVDLDDFVSKRYKLVSGVGEERALKKLRHYQSQATLPFTVRRQL